MRARRAASVSWARLASKVHAPEPVSARPQRPAEERSGFAVATFGCFVAAILEGVREMLPKPITPNMPSASMKRVGP